MSEIALRATHLSKRFVLGANKRRGLKERLVRRRGQPRGEEIWALRDASFEVARGESFGLVGHNGSGKSTALKVLTGIYRPTEGSVEVNGRVSALLELGAGFHGELTGRENIRLNGSILGLSKRQIEAMTDEIIDFSGIEQFIDSPVKVYSSGMYMRLGFAIAVKLDPEILIIDEIIAVGDEEFQRKCFDYMYDLRQAGTTIVLVSHGLANIERMCDSAAWLDHGRVRLLGTSEEVVDAYLDDVNRRESSANHRAQGPGEAVVLGSGEVELESLEYLDASGEPIPEMVVGREVVFRLHYVAHESARDAIVGIGFFTQTGGLLTAPSTRRVQGGVMLPKGRGHIDLRVAELPLAAGTYRLTTLIGREGRWFDVREKAFTLTVRAGGIGDGGQMMFPGEWSLHHDEAAPDAAAADEEDRSAPPGLGGATDAAPPQDRAGLVQVNDRRLGDLWFPKSDEVVAPAIARTGIWEPLEGLWLDHVVRPGMTVVNVGANVGYFAVWAAQLVGDSGHVLAVEPHPGNCELVRRNVADRGLEQVVRTIEAAASDRAGSVTLYLNDHNNGDHRVFAPPAVDQVPRVLAGLEQGFAEDPPTIDVPAVRLDDLLADHRVDALQTDTQGWDHHVLRGARQILTRDRPVVLCEFTPHWITAQGDDPVGVIHEIEDLGYDVGTWDGAVPPGDWSAEQLVAWVSQRWFTNLELWPRERPIPPRVRPTTGFAAVERTTRQDRYWMVRDSAVLRLAGPPEFAGRFRATLAPPGGYRVRLRVGETGLDLTAATAVDVPVQLDERGRGELTVTALTPARRLEPDPRPLFVALLDPVVVPAGS